VLDDSKWLLERAEEEHAECIRRWEKMRKRFPRLQGTILHGVEAHLPSDRHIRWKGGPSER
jgi:hypothetical protein